MDIQYNFSLKAMNTFMMDVSCRRFINIESEADIPAMAGAGWFKEPYYILGGGSNTLFTGNYEGTVMHPAFKGIEITENTGNFAVLRVAAGEPWNNVIQYCLQHRLYGIENLVGIPGLAGSAPVQNIGAYGMEIADSIKSVEGFMLPDIQNFTFNNAQCRFGYRDSVFKNDLKGRCFITHVNLKLSGQEHYNLSYNALKQKISSDNSPLSMEKVTDAILQIRNSRLPDISEVGCAGSFFQNPIVSRVTLDHLLQSFPDISSFPIDDERVKLSAGQLIEKAGWKGKTAGRAGTHPQHALIIVNRGGAVPAEIIDIYEQIVRDVYQKFEIRLNPEVNII